MSNVVGIDLGTTNSLVAYVREHYGTISRRPWKMPPYATSRRSRDTERAIANGGLSPGPKWGLPS